MNRLFGAKNTTPKPTLNSAIASVRVRHLQTTPILMPQVDARVESVDVKLAKLTAELSAYQQKLSRMRDGPGKTALRQKALKLLQQRRQYEGQREQLQQQSWNMEQAGMLQDNLQNTLTTVDAMKTTTKALRRQYGRVDIARIDKMQDEMAELMDMGNEIQESISRSYDVPEDVDEADLDAELDALGQEVELEAAGGESEGVPAFMLDEPGLPAFVNDAPETRPVREAAG